MRVRIACTDKEGVGFSYGPENMNNCKIKNPRDANGPDGYPKDNPEFRRLCNIVIARNTERVKQAELFLKLLLIDMRNLDK